MIKKTEKWILGLIILILLIVAYQHYEDTKVIKLIHSPENIQILKINQLDIKNEAQFEGQFDEIVATLSHYNSNYKRYGYKRDGMTRVWYEIIILDEAELKFIVLGDDNYWYDGSGKMYTIIDGKELLEEIRVLVK
ncbi:hypothetical protein [Fusibacter sp. 3D3]|uniref:hypothetical protein n=1 Tax=Fusibacter sp. 3D3 TaxID=1048380 RepID=UPI0008533A73|nr:hypothetical protein [Fusibacter sp. 3D3]GAU76156.1 hypothetical protein F3D3_0753 [Fusibacter sp. 3D3]